MYVAGPRSCLPPIADVCRISAGLINLRNGAKNIIKNDDDDDDDDDGYL